MNDSDYGFAYDWVYFADADDCGVGVISLFWI
jgi:hypothetical protein